VREEEVVFCGREKIGSRSRSERSDYQVSKVRQRGGASSPMRWRGVSVGECLDNSNMYFKSAVTGLGATWLGGWG
jgi:hypothetical protein